MVMLRLTFGVSGAIDIKVFLPTLIIGVDTPLVCYWSTDQLILAQALT